MPKLIDADKLKQHYAWWDNEDKKIFDTIVDLQPTVDAVEVVRCKDCQYRGSTAECLERGDDWFCADGKRREDGR